MKFGRLRGIGMAWLVMGCALLGGRAARGADQEFLAGADVSMLPALEKAGAVYQQDGKPGDAIGVLRAHGCNLFRVRLFVKPDPVFSHTDGALQDLDYVRSLGQRIKAAGGVFLLDIHYSDTWADPGKQFKPKEWKNLSFEALVQKVHDYTASVLSDLAAAGCEPDMVQVGNEITPGMLWPDGQVYGGPKGDEAVKWSHLAMLINAGAKAVREAQTDSHKIRVVIHIDGGGKKGRSKYFFDHLLRATVDFDVVGLSFYPAWDDSMENLKTNMAEVIASTGKDVFVAETSYPWQPMKGNGTGSAMLWPSTPLGQEKYLADLTDALRAAPGHHGIGYAWWYPEAIPVAGLRIWRNGAEALFDGQGHALPAMDEFSATPKMGTLGGGVE